MRMCASYIQVPYFLWIIIINNTNQQLIFKNNEIYQSVGNHTSTTLKIYGNKFSSWRENGTQKLTVFIDFQIIFAHLKCCT